MILNILATAVETLLETYSIESVIIFILLIAFAFKEILSLIDWFKNRGKNKLTQINNQENRENQVQQIIDAQRRQSEEIRDMKHCIEMLIISDKNDIKAWITQQYHIIMERGWVDDYELDCLERRYSDYKQEGGNSYIEDLMEDIRKLPKASKAQPR